MFYSHEVLTSRKYGVATVWLIATLGSKSKLKKINRKAILDVDVQKACKTIVSPEAPLALRLQSNLLYGISRVYLQQCGYVLADAQHAHNAMRMMLKIVKNAELDPEAGKARPEQLILQDDPSFLPEFTLPPLNLNFGDFDQPMPWETPRSGESQSLTPFGSQLDHSTPEGQVGGIILPSSSSRGMGGFVVQGDDGPGTIGGPGSMLEPDVNIEGLDQLEFEIDADGNLIEITPNRVISGTSVAPGGGALPSDGGASARVRGEHEEGQRAGAELLDDQMDLDIPILGEDLPEREAFPTAPRPESGQPSEAVGSTSTVSAPMRQKKKRISRLIPLDTAMELRNKDLADWNTNYLQNMAEASRIKNQHRQAMQAKKNAEHWVWGAGIGGIGNRPAGATGPTPFDMFYGDNLFELLTGVNRRDLAGTKHDRDSGIDEETQAESRRVRHKLDEDQEQIGRAAEDEVMFVSGGDEEVELPREAPSALDDQQMFSAMPWNISASIRGSSVVPRSGRPGLPSSLTGRSRASRMISASPLHGRGQPGGLEALRGLEGEDGYGILGPGGLVFAPGLGEPSSDDLPGLPLSSPPIPQPSFRVREALSAEGSNFLAWISRAVAEKRARVQQELELMSDVLQREVAGDIDEVLFEELLTPQENTRIVAAQGLMMVLALGIKGLLNVRQDEAFGEIRLRLTEVKEEGGEQERQFEELFQAGITGADAEEEEDPHADLYDD
ncbi:hypothetical protein K469DRAFT_656799 [Zopfia rhizophila CBS 207.26]|uniref:Rad21/Rec8-like protein N-terminal domain-containing protein n=1 Tax=Zopfia rhizophila CBS 207.26 TaxID=1314779 RepID=A0A6A6EFF8_9PEZI|nr:hypothetical protein K469DRAFT_656799 [Zopfia rhizophila CBS 207.26]